MVSVLAKFMQTRAVAAIVVSRVLLDGQSLTAALAACAPRAMADDRPLVQELAFGTMRWHARLEAISGLLLQRPLRSKDADIAALLAIGLYQLIETRVPPHAAVSETVDAAQALGKGWARGMLNACLRRFQREQDELLAEVDADAATASAHPPWLFGKLRKFWPDDWPAILEANNARPPMTLRVDLTRSSREAWIERAMAEEIEATPHPASPAAVTLIRPVDVTRLPGFAAGDVSVQDGAAQFAAQLLDPQPGDRVLDACAAPGGKTLHLLEQQPALASLLALDSDPERLERITENLERAGRTALLATGDAAHPKAWWEGELFDRILVDAPCSATGVIRRHPDIKTLRRPDDLPPLVATQGAILDALWPLLAPAGRLLYATCSVLPEENERQIHRFLATHTDAREEPIEGKWGRPRAHGRQILPGELGMDGFYYACISRDD